MPICDGIRPNHEGNSAFTNKVSGEPSDNLEKTYGLKKIVNVFELTFIAVFGGFAQRFFLLYPNVVPVSFDKSFGGKKGLGQLKVYTKDKSPSKYPRERCALGQVLPSGGG